MLVLLVETPEPITLSAGSSREEAPGRSGEIDLQDRRRVEDGGDEVVDVELALGRFLLGDAGTQDVAGDVFDVVGSDGVTAGEEGRSGSSVEQVDLRTRRSADSDLVLEAVVVLVLDALELVEARTGGTHERHDVALELFGRGRSDRLDGRPVGQDLVEGDDLLDQLLRVALVDGDVAEDAKLEIGRASCRERV